MTTNTYSKARQHFSDVLDQAHEKGEIFVQGKDGSLFVIKPLSRKRSHLDVPGVDIDISREEIVDSFREIRER